MNLVSAVDDDMTVVYMNPACKAELGDLVGKKCFETALGSQEICRTCPVKANWDYAKGPHIRRITDAKGNTLEVHVSKYKDPDSDKVFWIAVEHDITPQVLAEKKLQVLTTSVHQMTEPVCVADTDGKLIYVNRAYSALTGYDASRGSDIRLESSSPDSQVTTLQAILRAALEKEWSGEMSGVRKDGGRYYMQVDARPVRDDSGATLAVVGILHDVTRSKSEKVEFQKYQQELESRMEARTNELARKVSQLTTINKISRVVTSILDLDELISEYVKAIAQGF
ncbi:MAG: PAS domain-containing protein, partial [Thermoplasmata archaeon]|nr:PAS domain-containing protein [Thermoplasmata archaeon]